MGRPCRHVIQHLRGFSSDVMSHENQELLFNQHHKVSRGQREKIQERAKRTVQNNHFEILKQ